MVMLNHSQAHAINKLYPGRIGLMISPVRLRPTRGLPVVLDNGRFAVWSSGKEWDESQFWEMLDTVQKTDKPLWVVVPDVVGDSAGTFREWNSWAHRLHNRGIPLALAVQDGMTPTTVKENCDPDVIFVGGTRRWKRQSLETWCQAFPRVHCGRVNYERWLWHSEELGVESTDGTGWFRGDQNQLKGLHRYLERSSKGIGPLQQSFEFS